MYRKDVYKLTFNAVAQISTQDSAIQDYSSIYHSDIAVFGRGYTIWINHTDLAVVAPDEFELPKSPDNVFTFARLASITLVNESYSSYLYHQINGTTFAEEQWDGILEAWTATEYIPISYS